MIEQLKSFNYNLPLQAWREEDGSIRVLNYMPRRERCNNLDLSELKDDGIVEKDYFYGVSVNLINLAILFAEFAEGKRYHVYYHDEDLDKHFYPAHYAHHVSSIIGDRLLKAVNNDNN